MVMKRIPKGNVVAKGHVCNVPVAAVAERTESATETKVQSALTRSAVQYPGGILRARSVDRREEARRNTSIT
jgi:hypothetical protein